MRCNGRSSLLQGMPTVALQKALADAQQAYIDLSTGAKGESYSYSQGDGTRSVTYTKADLAQLQVLIRSLQQQLGISCRSRYSLGFKF